MSKSGKIYSLLQRFRLECYYNAFLELGVKDERDFIDSIDDEDLATLGLSHTEKKRFGNMKIHIQRLGSGIEKSVEAFHVTYTFPKCSEPSEISNIDPSQNTLEDLMLRIGFQEQIGNDKAVCLYTLDGMPLTDDPFFNTWSLKERHIENGSELYAIFTPKQNLRAAPRSTSLVKSEIPGDDTVRCHIMLKGDYEIDVDLENDKLWDLRRKLSNESGIPEHTLHARDIEGGPGQSLEDLEISSESVVNFSLSSFENTYMNDSEFFTSDISPSVPQTQKGMSVFFSTFCVIYKQISRTYFQNVIAYIRKLTGCSALTQALYQVVCRGEYGTRNQKIAIVEGLYLLFRELLPSLTKKTGFEFIEDAEVFEHSNVCWAYLMTQSEDGETEYYAAISLICEGSGKRLCEPVRIPGIYSVFDRAYVVEKIKSEEKIPGCSEENLKETSIQRATDIERILLSLPLAHNFPVCISSGSGCNFQVDPEQTFAEMTAGLSKFPYLQPTPPLQLMSQGFSGPALVYIRDNLCLWESRCKDCPRKACFQDFLAGKIITEDVELLALQTGDLRRTPTFQINRVPKEAILVLVDESSSMTRKCYTSWNRIDAVKQLFHSFADRSMAYNFPHVIGLVKVGMDVKFHKFTESLDTFMAYVRELEARGTTPLYDALNLGLSELLNIKECFPNCRLRMLCLTDGYDEGSSIDPVQVTVKLLNANIVVDSILLGKELNTVLHGISNATGGCCFKPETSKDALKLFEMETVLSLERRKLKTKFAASSVQKLTDLTKIFQLHGFDDQPEVVHPEELSHKVTLLPNALKKKILESKSGRFMDKDRRILEELKHLHIDPHPYCTVLPSETDFSFWKILMKGPPDTPYADGAFELYCKFGDDYPLKPPLVRFLTPIYHCNVNSVGRICHNIFDRDYSAHITMKEILEAVYGLLIAPEAEDPLDRVTMEGDDIYDNIIADHETHLPKLLFILAEEFLSSRDKYEEQAKKSTTQVAATPIDDMEKKLVGEDLNQVKTPSHLICKLSNKMFVDPVITPHGDVYERQAIENVLKKQKTDPFNNRPLEVKDLRPNKEMKSMARKYESQIQADLTKIFQSHGFDDQPEVVHPEELSHKMTLLPNALKKKILESKSGRFMDKIRRILEELKHLHIDPHPYCTVLPSETDFSFWKILMKGPPDTPYADGAFELYCKFGDDYPLKPPLVRFLTPIYHCNVNSEGRISHKIFDRDYSAHITMKEILEAVYGLLIAPEAEDPLGSILAEEFLSSRYEEQAKKSTTQVAATRIDDIEKKLVGEDLNQVKTPSHLICKLSNKMFVDPVITPHGDVYECQAIENVLKKQKTDPFNNRPLEVKDLRPNKEMKSMARKYESQIQADLTKIFQSHGFDDQPEVVHPEELSHKMTLLPNALKKKILESKSGRFMDKIRRILEELKHLHIDPHPYCTVLPSETDFSFWKILMKGPPDTPYADGAFELYCKFGDDYPLKPPLVRFLTPIYHCNVNSEGRISHKIFDRDYSAHITMKEILEAVSGLLIAPEAEDPLGSILAEEFLSSRYEEQAKKSTTQVAATRIDDIEKKLVGEDLSRVKTPSHLICKLSNKMFVDPVITPHGDVYERRAIENVLKKQKTDPFNNRPLAIIDLRPNKEMRIMVRKYRESQIQQSA